MRNQKTNYIHINMSSVYEQHLYLRWSFPVLMLPTWILYSLVGFHWLVFAMNRSTALMNQSFPSPSPIESAPIYHILQLAMCLFVVRFHPSVFANFYALLISHVSSLKFFVVSSIRLKGAGAPSPLAKSLTWAKHHSLHHVKQTR